MHEQILELLKNQLDELITLTNGQGKISISEGEAWIGATAGLFERIYGTDSIKIKEISSLKKTYYGSIDDNNFYHPPEFIPSAKSIIGAVFSEIKLLGLPESSDKGEGLNLTVNQSQTSVQSVKVKVKLLVEILGDDLSGRQFEEIKEVLDSKDSDEEKKSKLMEKLKGFGIDTVSSILSGVISNSMLG